jgi:asparagine synthase (glutamine-hydrolysing)
MPLADWFVGGFSDFAYEAWTSSGAGTAGFLDAREVRGLFEEHRRGLGNHGRLLYALAMFSCWWKDQQQEIRRQQAPQPRLAAERQAVHA